MSRTLIVTPFGRTEQLAAACVLSNIHANVVPVGDFSAICQDDLGPEDTDRIAGTVSKLAGEHEVLVLVASPDQIDAGHYRGGKREADVPAGLALNNLPPLTEQLLLSAKDPADVEGHIDTSRMTKLQASAATMTAARASLARTALLWLVVAILGCAAVVLGALLALGGHGVAWVAVGVAAVVMLFSLFRVYRLLGKRR